MPEGKEYPVSVVSAWGHDAWGVDARDEDVDLIANAPADIEFLLQALEAAEGDNESLRTALTREGDALKLVLAERAAAERRAERYEKALEAIGGAAKTLGWDGGITGMVILALTKQEEGEESAPNP